MSQESFNIILPVGLFIVSILISFILHAMDKHNRNLSTVKKMVDQFSEKVQSGQTALETEIAELENELGTKEDRVRELINSVTENIEKLEHYSEDLAVLRKAMQKYKDSINALLKLTEDADNSMNLIKGDIQNLDQYKAEFEKIKEETVEQVKNACSQADQDAVSNKENVKKEYDSILNDFKSSADEFITGQIDRVNRAVEDKIANLTLSAQSLISSQLQATMQNGQEREEQKTEERWVTSEMPVIKTEEPEALEQETKKEDKKDSLVGSDINNIEYDGQEEEIVFD